MGEIDAIHNQIRALARQYEGQKAQNAAIESKIAKLEQAKGIMVIARERALELERKMEKFHVAERWQGMLGRNTESTRTAMKANAAATANAIREGIGDIDRHIWNLRLQVNYLVKLMGAVEDGISDLQREIARLKSGQ